MRVGVLVFALACIVAFSACARTQAWTKTPTGAGAPVARIAAKPAAKENSSTITPRESTTAPAADAASEPETVDFQTQIRPVFEARCQPCHFSGGQVYREMPFDRPETIKSLGNKLFTRIKDEKSGQLIREFLDQK